MKTFKKLTVLLLLITIQAFAQKKDYSNEPGYVDFGNLSQFDSGERVVEVKIDEKYLRMVSKFTGDDEPELSALIDGLKLIKVNTFGVTETNNKDIMTKMNAIGGKLENDNWDILVKVRDKSEFVNVFVHSPDGDIINGLVVMAIDEDDEAVFVNIVGHIDLEKIGELTRKFDLPGLDEIIDENHQEKDKNDEN